MNSDQVIHLTEEVREAVQRGAAAAGLDPLYGTALAQMLAILTADFCGVVERMSEEGSPMDAINLWLAMTLTDEAVHRFMGVFNQDPAIASRHDGKQPQLVVQDGNVRKCPACMAVLSRFMTLPPLLTCWRCGAYLKSQEDSS